MASLCVPLLNIPEFTIAIVDEQPFWNILDFNFPSDMTIEDIYVKETTEHTIIRLLSTNPREDRQKTLSVYAFPKYLVCVKHEQPL